MSLAPSGLDLGFNFPATGPAGKPPPGFRPMINPVTGAPAQLVQTTGLAFDPYQRFAGDIGSVDFDLEPRNFILPQGGLGQAESLGMFPGETGPTIFRLPETSSYPNPQAAQAAFKALQTPEAQAAWLANEQQQMVAEGKTLAGQEEGIGTLEDAISLVLARQREFRDDPNRAAIREGLMARAGPDYRAFGQAEEADLLNQIARTASTAASRRLYSSGGQGGPGTASTAAQATADAIAASQGVSAVATIDAINRAARDAALGDVSAFQAAEDQVEAFLLQKVTELETLQASIEAGNEFVPGDFTPFLQMDWGLQQAEDLFKRLDEAEANAVQSQEVGGLDVGQLILSMVGQGAFGS